MQLIFSRSRSPFERLILMLVRSPFRETAFAIPALFGILIGYSFLRAALGQDPAPSQARNPVLSVPVNNSTIETKTYLDQAWELKGRSGLTANSGLVWDSATREWRLKSRLPDEALKAIAHYASWTATPARVGVSIAQSYGELDKIDELAKFYNVFLKAYFVTFGELRKVNAPEIKQKLLGPELGPDSARTLAWYWKQPDGSIILRDCYACNAEYFFPAARLVRAIAELKPRDRTAAMIQFVATYCPLLVREHLLRPNFAERMREDMNPGSPGYKKHIMNNDEIADIAAAAEMLGAYGYDPQVVAISDVEVAKLKELVRVGVDRFQFSRTLSKDAFGRTCASYFNGDYDGHEDMEYARYNGQSFPTAAQKAKAEGASWDISHFSLIPMFLWSLSTNKRATGVDFPEKTDIAYIANQFAFHVFEGDYARPLFKNFFDGSDGWYRVNYSGRSSYGIAPSRLCNMFDPSHGCATIAGIYSWGLLASLNPDIARVQIALIDLARGGDPSIACFQPQCFRERYYRYADTSFSFVDADGRVQYPPALIVVLSELTLSFSGSPSWR